MDSKNKIKRLLFSPIVLFMVLAAVLPIHGKGVVLDGQARDVGFKEQFPSMGNLDTVPTKPETIRHLFEASDVFVYALIDTVKNKIEKHIQAGPRFEGDEIFPEQRCTGSFLWVLKGDVGLQNSTVSVIKEKSRYCLSEKENRVLYLQKDGNLFRTIDGFGGEHRLASALCDIRDLKRDATSGGIVASFHQGNDKSLHPIVHVLKGRRKTSLEINDNEWDRFLLKTIKIGKFNICEIPLQEGVYTVLMERNGNLFS